MSEQKLLFPVPPHFRAKAWIDEAGYRRRYERSLRDPQAFWAEQAATLDWVRKPSRIREVSFGPDDINVSGHRLGTVEIESALVAHPKVAEAAVVGYPHELKGQGIHAYVTLKADVPPSEELRRDLVRCIRDEIGPIASPDRIQWASALPKTRSGKIMRRILRRIAEGDGANLGDISTLADPGVVDGLVRERAAG